MRTFPAPKNGLMKQAYILLPPISVMLPWSIYEIDGLNSVLWRIHIYSNILNAQIFASIHLYIETADKLRLRLE